MPPKNRLGAGLAHRGDEVRPGADADHADEAGQAQRLHELHRAVRHAAEQRPHRAQVAGDDAGHQRADAGADRDADPGDMERCRRAEQGADEDREADRDEIGDVGRLHQHAQHLRPRAAPRPRRRPRGGRRRARSTVRRPCGISRPWRMMRRRNTPCTASSLASDCRVRPTTPALGDEDLVARHRDVEQFAVVDFIAPARRPARPAPRAGRPRRPRRRPRCAGPACAVDDLAVAAHAQHEQARAGDARLRLADRAPDDRRAVVDRGRRGTRYGCHAEVTPWRSRSMPICSSSRERLGAQVDAEQARRDVGAEQHHAQRAEHVAQRVGHADVRDQQLALVLGERQRGDRLRGGAHRRRLGQRAGQQAGGEARRRARAWLATAHAVSRPTTGMKMPSTA